MNERRGATESTVHANRHTEQFACVEDRTDDRGDVVDWLGLTAGRRR